MRLVVTTWNLQGSAGVDRDAVVAHLQEQGSDVVLFQEVQRKQARRLARALSARSLTWSLKHWTVSTRPEGMAVVGVTLPLDRAKARALTRRWRVWSWRRRIVQFARLEDLALANVHLTPHGEDGARAREVAAILHRFPTTGRTGRAVAGDFNARPGASLLGQLISGGLHDAWVLAGAGDGDDDEREGATNWSSHRRVGAPDQRIDYLWVSPEVVVRGAWTPRYGDPGFEQFPRLSDHLPLTVELDI